MRKLAAMAGSLGFCVFVFAATCASSLFFSAGMLACAAFCSRVAAVGFFINFFDLCPTTAGMAVGISNTFASLTGILGQPLTQKLLDATGSFRVPFGVGAAVHMLGALVFISLASDISIEDDWEVTDKLAALAPRLTAAAPGDDDSALQTQSPARHHEANIGDAGLSPGQ